MNNSTKLKRGLKHPIKNLIFWQYHHPFYKETNGEVWLTPGEFEKKRGEHAKKTARYRKSHPLMNSVSGAIQRDRQKYQTNKSEIIDLKYIEYLLKKNKKVNVIGII